MPRYQNPFRHLKEYIGEIGMRVSRLGVELDGNALLGNARSFLELLDAHQEFAEFSPRELAKYAISQCFSPRGEYMTGLDRITVAVHHLLLPRDLYEELNQTRQRINNKIRAGGKEPSLYAKEIKLKRKS